MGVFRILSLWLWCRQRVDRDSWNLGSPSRRVINWMTKHVAIFGESELLLLLNTVCSNFTILTLRTLGASHSVSDTKKRLCVMSCVLRVVCCALCLMYTVWCYVVCVLCGKQCGVVRSCVVAPDLGDGGNRCKRHDLEPLIRVPNDAH